jgi:hypothetical protein
LTTSDNRSTISYLDVFPLLSAACPTYGGSTQATEANAKDGEYLLVGSLVAHLVQLLEKGCTDSFSTVFGVVEWVLTDGDEEAARLITDGFLDDLANPDLYGEATKQPTDFALWLGPGAREHGRLDPNI